MNGTDQLIDLLVDRSKTWDDIERGARDDAFLYAIINIAQRPGMTREQALITGVLALAKDRSRLLQQEIQRLMGASRLSC